ncbi:hypothetical protein D9M71_556410 [compost metagenome]
MLLVGHAQVGQERPGQFQVAFFLTVMCRGGNFTRLLGRVAVQHRFAFFAEFQLQFIAQGQQMSITERLGQQRGNQRLGLCQGQVAGDVAGLVAVHE